jgi:hypothetical protein
MESKEDRIMPPNKRPLISKYPGNNVAAASSDLTTVGATVIPVGKTIRLTCFGAAIPAGGTVALELRTEVGPDKWRTLRCVIGPGSGHFESFQPIEGDGVIAALRIKRTNDEASPQKIKAWVEGYRR